MPLCDANLYLLYGCTALVSFGLAHTAGHYYGYTHTHTHVLQVCSTKLLSLILTFLKKKRLDHVLHSRECVYEREKEFDGVSVRVCVSLVNHITVCIPQGNGSTHIMATGL